MQQEDHWINFRKNHHGRTADESDLHTIIHDYFFNETTFENFKRNVTNFINTRDKNAFFHRNLEGRNIFHDIFYFSFHKSEQREKKTSTRTSKEIIEMFEFIYQKMIEIDSKRTIGYLFEKNNQDMTPINYISRWKIGRFNNPTDNLDILRAVQEITKQVFYINQTPIINILEKDALKHKNNQIADNPKEKITLEQINQQESSSSDEESIENKLKKLKQKYEQLKDEQAKYKQKYNKKKKENKELKQLNKQMKKENKELKKSKDKYKQKYNKSKNNDVLLVSKKITKTYQPKQYQPEPNYSSSSCSRISSPISE